MDEAEKYRQRLEAIAEKRRQQDEQERARREMEDEKLRLQQLKRKSLRDQWLMEGAPLSPASPDIQSPQSPPWSSEGREIEKSESQRLAEEKEREQMEDGHVQEAAEVTEAGTEMVHDDDVQNGENNSRASGTTEDEVKTNKSPLLDETAGVLTNGGGDLEADTNHEDSEQGIQSNSNGPMSINMKLKPALSLGASEVESGHFPDVNINEEEEEGTLVMRAECVIITDEGDDVPEDPTPQGDQQEATHSEEAPLPKREAGREGGDDVEAVEKTEAAPESFTQPEKSEATEPSAEAQLATGNGEMDGDVKTKENGDGEIKAEGQDGQSEDLVSVQLQSPAAVQEGNTVASVPVYSEEQPSTLIPKAEGEATTTPGGSEAASRGQDPATMPGQFQEVSLADPEENQRTEAGLGEQEPLLSQATAPNTQAEPTAANSPATSETHSPTRASQGEETQAPKRKTCQCCSVM